ncbi:Protein decapping 5 [Camellia lanceoleosa]|uniref:Protein decapping 5 n=1 Tax=Camellia lanceoleosa TaxID=1840588 RepID=A0ACC0F7X6_9ERIC|nr:Protein decapping 5 [Camellia lanceoleosa]
MDSTECSGSAADSYIDSFISLISNSQIRYQGFLFHLNPQQSTIGLRNVKSFGTEGRRKDEPQVLPSDKIYEYIFFRGSDIEDLQVISSPPVQSTTAVPNDPAIIQAWNLPLNQPVGSLGSWSSLPPPPTANGNGFSTPTYWPRHSGTSGGVSHLQQQSLLRPPQGFPVSPLVQHQMQNPTTNTSLPGNASNFSEFSSPMLPTVGTGFPSLTSNMPPPLALPSTVPTRQSATLPSKLSPNLMPNNASNALPTVTVGSNSTLASPLTTSSLDVNPVVPPVMDKPKPVFDPALPNQTISQSMPSAVGLSGPVHSESSIPSLLTAGQLLQPGSTGQSSPHLQTAHRGIEVDKTSTSESVSSDSKNANNPAESLQSPYAAKPNTASVQTHHSYRGCGWRNGTEVCPTTTKFTDDFDFEAMNEKFNKEKIWGHLGKKNKTTLEDDEGEENNNDANVAEEEDEDGLIKFVMKSFYVKDNFFDSLSCNSPNHELGRGRANLSEQRRIDIETFGEIPRHQRGHSSQGGPGWGGQSQGGSYRGRGYGYVGRGRGRTVWCRVT